MERKTVTQTTNPLETLLSQKLITVKIARLGEEVVERVFPVGTTVKDALEAAGITPRQDEDIRLNGKPAELNMPIEDEVIVTLVPRIKGAR
jgi:hypothetical protein